MYDIYNIFLTILGIFLIVQALKQNPTNIKTCTIKIGERIIEITAPLLASIGGLVIIICALAPNAVNEIQSKNITIDGLKKKLDENEKQLTAVNLLFNKISEGCKDWSFIPKDINIGGQIDSETYCDPISNYEVSIGKQPIAISQAGSFDLKSLPYQLYYNINIKHKLKPNEWDDRKRKICIENMEIPPKNATE